MLFLSRSLKSVPLTGDDDGTEGASAHIHRLGRFCWAVLRPQSLDGFAAYLLLIAVTVIVMLWPGKVIEWITVALQELGLL